MSFSLIDIWSHMGFTARAVNFTMLLMSIYSLSIMIERFLTFRKAKKQSRLYAPKVAKLLKDGKIQDAIKVSSGKEVKNSHLAKVLLAGLQEYQYQKESGEGTRSDMMESAHRAIERATALNLTDLKRGLSGLATVGSNGSVRRTLRHRGRHHQRVPRHGAHWLRWYRRRLRRYRGSSRRDRIPDCSWPSPPCGRSTT